MQNESGRSMIEMIIVLILMGTLTIGGILAYKNAQNQSKATGIAELVSIASVNGLTKMKDYDNSKIWNVIGKKYDDYKKCVSSLSVKANGQVIITFKPDCDKIKKILTTQWGSFWKAETSTYTPPKDDE